MPRTIAVAILGSTVGVDLCPAEKACVVNFSERCVASGCGGEDRDVDVPKTWNCISMTATVSVGRLGPDLVAGIGFRHCS